MTPREELMALASNVASGEITMLSLQNRLRAIAAKLPADPAQPTDVHGAIASKQPVNLEPVAWIGRHALARVKKNDGVLDATTGAATMSEELKPLPCPFCGSQPFLDKCGDHSTAWTVSCPSGYELCGADPHVWRESQNEAIATWNRRAESPEVAGLRAKVAALEARIALAPTAVAEYSSGGITRDVVGCKFTGPEFMWLGGKRCAVLVLEESK